MNIGPFLFSTSTIISRDHATLTKKGTRQKFTRDNDITTSLREKDYLNYLVLRKLLQVDRMNPFEKTQMTK